MRRIHFLLVFFFLTGLSCGNSTAVNTGNPARPAEAASTTNQSRGFTGKSGHKAQGTVALERSGDSWNVVFNADFDFDGAPAPIVALGKDGYRKETMLGKLKANKGRQVYEIPDSLKLDEFNEVWLWCTMYDVPLGVAALSK